jgi:hypothetical protein
MVRQQRKRVRRKASVSLEARRLYEAEQLFLDFRELTPFVFKPFVKSFRSFRAYERWRNAQTNPWYR